MEKTKLKLLANILQLERDQKFNDRSVIGGVTKFISSQDPDITTYFSEKFGPSSVSLLKFDYTSATTPKRKIWVEQVHKHMVTMPHVTDTHSIVTRPRANKNLPPSTQQNPSLFGPITDIKGIDIKTSDKLSKLGISNAWDIFYNSPRFHLDYSHFAAISEIASNRPTTITGIIVSSKTLRLGAGGKLLAGEIVVQDTTGSVRCLWYGNRFISKTLKQNMSVTISGTPTYNQNRLTFLTPEYEIGNGDHNIHTGRLLPIYRLTAGLTAKRLRTFTWNIIQQFEKLMPTQHLPTNFYSQNCLLPLPKAVSQFHFPDSLESWEEAKKSLGFEELLSLQLALKTKTSISKPQMTSSPITAPKHFLESFCALLPFALTESQRTSIQEILEDLQNSLHPMNRLLQGDVGSGKTVVVTGAILATMQNGFQAALMVPTEILAEQHFSTLQSLIKTDKSINEMKGITSVFSPLLNRFVTIGLLTGSTTAANKKTIYAEANSGKLDLLIGTHALINQDLKFSKLNLVITDEQHRFGVLQRSELVMDDRIHPHNLAMSATPIPRSLSLTLYGELRISTISHMPVGRTPIKTKWIPEEKKEVAYGFIRKHVISGSQAFIVCPAIEKNPLMKYLSAKEVYTELTEIYLSDLSVELLHGKMSAKQKEQTMTNFRNGVTQILVSTSVIEVGVDVPNANVMLIHGADRFGLSQLHQFRGRVGRGQEQSYCILLCTDPSETASARLSALEQTTNGFTLAEIDLKLRGPGDYFGVRQSGVPSMRLANLFDLSLMQLAKSTAQLIFEKDPHLTAHQHAHLKQTVETLLADLVTDPA